MKTIRFAAILLALVVALMPMFVFATDEEAGEAVPYETPETIQEEVQEEAPEVEPVEAVSEPEISDITEENQENEEEAVCEEISSDTEESVPTDAREEVIAEDVEPSTEDDNPVASETEETGESEESDESFEDYEEDYDEEDVEECGDEEEDYKWVMMLLEWDNVVDFIKANPGSEIDLSQFGISAEYLDDFACHLAGYGWNDFYLIDNGELITSVVFDLSDEDADEADAENADTAYESPKAAIDPETTVVAEEVEEATVITVDESKEEAAMTTSGAEDNSVNTHPTSEVPVRDASGLMLSFSLFAVGVLKALSAIV